MVTSTRQITNEQGTISLWDLIDTKTLKYTKEPCLEFTEAVYDSLWDNSEYVLKFLKGLKRNKKKQISELKEFCTENKLHYSTVSADLIGIYKQSKKEKFWK